MVIFLFFKENNQYRATRSVSLKDYPEKCSDKAELGIHYMGLYQTGKLAPGETPKRLAEGNNSLSSLSSALPNGTKSMRDYYADLSSLRNKLTEEEGSFSQTLVWEIEESSPSPNVKKNSAYDYVRSFQELLVEFEGNSNRLKNWTPNQDQLVSDIAKYLIENPSVKLEITGHVGELDQSENPFLADISRPQPEVTQTGEAYWEQKTGTLTNAYTEDVKIATTPTQGTLMLLRAGAIRAEIINTLPKEAVDARKNLAERISICRGTWRNRAANRRVTFRYF